MSYEAEYNRLKHLLDFWEKTLHAWGALRLGSGHSRQCYLYDGHVYKLPHGVENIDQNLSEAYQWRAWADGLTMGRPCRPARSVMIDEVMLQAEYIPNHYHEGECEDGCEEWPEGMPCQGDFEYGSDKFQGGKDASGQWVQIDFALYERATCSYLLSHSVWQLDQDYIWPDFYGYAKWCLDQDKPKVPYNYVEIKSGLYMGADYAKAKDWTVQHVVMNLDGKPFVCQPGTHYIPVDPEVGF